MMMTLKLSRSLLLYVRQITSCSNLIYLYKPKKEPGFDEEQYKAWRIDKNNSYKDQMGRKLYILKYNMLYIKF